MLNLEVRSKVSFWYQYQRWYQYNTHLYWVSQSEAPLAHPWADILLVIDKITVKWSLFIVWVLKCWDMNTTNSHIHSEITHTNNDCRVHTTHIQQLHKQQQHLMRCGKDISPNTHTNADRSSSSPVSFLSTSLYIEQTRLCLWLNELEEGWFKMNPFTKGTQRGFHSPGAHLNGGGLVSGVHTHECHKNPEPSNTVCKQQHAGTEMGLRNGRNGGKGRIHKIYKKRC